MQGDAGPAHRTKKGHRDTGDMPKPHLTVLVAGGLAVSRGMSTEAERPAMLNKYDDNLLVPERPQAFEKLGAQARIKHYSLEDMLEKLEASDTDGDGFVRLVDFEEREAGIAEHNQPKDEESQEVLDPGGWLRLEKRGECKKDETERTYNRFIGPDGKHETKLCEFYRAGQLGAPQKILSLPAGLNAEYKKSLEDSPLLVLHKDVLVKELAAARRLQSDATIEQPGGHCSIMRSYAWNEPIDKDSGLLVDLAPGEPIGSWLLKDYGKTGMSDRADFKHLAKELVSAVAFMHERGVIHMDLHLNNIIVLTQAKPKRRRFCFCRGSSCQEFEPRITIIDLDGSHVDAGKNYLADPDSGTSPAPAHDLCGTKGVGNAILHLLFGGAFPAPFTSTTEWCYTNKIAFTGDISGAGAAIVQKVTGMPSAQKVTGMPSALAEMLARTAVGGGMREACPDEAKDAKGDLPTLAKLVRLMDSWE